MSLKELEDNKNIQALVVALSEIIKTQGCSRTSNLWLQYIEQVNLVLLYMQVDRTGDWKLHLHAIKSMLPFFHAAGHHFYAKCAHLYVQQMEDLKKKMNPEEYKKFTEQGYFTICRKSRYWSGVASDMVIEQTLMKSMKVSGGLTQGRGVTNSILARWTLSFLIIMKVTEALENFCHKHFVSSEQHVERYECQKMFSQRS